MSRDGPIIINGSLSVDPDADPSSDMKLKFNWYCKQKGEKMTLDDGKTVDYPSSPSLSEPFTGCFGTGTGQLRGQHGSVLRLDGSFMKVMQTYMIWMQVTKSQRNQSVVKYELKVLDSEPPLVDIKCKLNCDVKVFESSRNPMSTLLTV